MEAKMKIRRSRRAWLVAGLLAAASLVAAGIYIGVMATVGPTPIAVETSFRSYVEGMAVSGKIVLVEARERVVIRQTTPGLLFGDTSIGRLLGIRSDATIEASAWADIAFVIDLYATESWSARYDPTNGGSLSVAAPPIGMLTPAIHTETIEIAATARSIFLDERRLEDSALRDLTARFVEAASAMIDDPELRAKARASVEAVARSFATAAGFPVASVDVSFAPAED
ncbi:MAG: hypothetical protein CVV47_16055 [Spirochaetae bacterium HGW-Spirochaetae-3]|jgi:hypothetical protein|nr:MAG: hypothetical protein CVV47_16055 [Spirochaetae bacterium HGW-Spirochaetae-3]